MSTSLASVWEDWLEYIEDRRVIPIVGAELLRVPHEGGDVPAQLLIARRLAERLGVSAEDLPEDDPLNTVVCRHIGKGGQPEVVYPRLRAVLRDNPLPVPPALRKLAKVRHFDLFVTTTFDTLLEQAINEERSGPHGGSAAVSAIAYAPNNVKDLPDPLGGPDRPTIVYHLLGRVSAAPGEYAVTEEDTLEFLYALQAERRRPERLFEELRNNHLLLIGNRFPDWLARFFIRLAKGGPLSGQRPSGEMLVDRLVHRDSNLVLFLQNFSHRTQVYPGAGAVEFVDEFVEQYLQRHPERRAAEAPDVGATAGAESDGGAAADVLPPGAVFLSYASQDREAVQKIHDALEAADLDAWFDRRQLEAGDDFRIKIRRNINACSLFVPVISATTRAREEGFFRREWKQAVDRAEGILEGVPFIVPVCIDDTPESEDANVPTAFLERHWARLPGGTVTPEFTRRMVELVRDIRRRQRG